MSRLHELAAAAGIAVDWVDAWGRPQRVAAETLAALLDALGLPHATPSDIDASLARLREEHASSVPPALLVAAAGGPTRLGRWAVPLAGRPYRIELEGGGRVEGRLSAAAGGGEAPAVELGAIERIGYHRLFAGGLELRVAVAPRRCYGIADALAGTPCKAQPWALAAQLYALRRAGDGGLGDFSALAQLAESAARRGAAALAISPVHAMFAADPGRYSPYGPSSRLFLNALHVDPAARFGSEALREAVAAVDAAGIFGPGASAPALLARCEAAARIDWPLVSRLRLALLRRLYEGAAFQGSAGLQAEFAAFRARGGEALEDHARFEALHARFNAGRGGGWRDWPAEFREPRAPAVAAEAERQAGEVGFHAFLQWLAASGLAGAQARARAAGMPIGLIADLAVGADGDGSQGWSRQGEMLAGLSVGAPPDVLNVHGQSWGLAAFSPRALERHGYGAWIEMLRAAFRHAGGVRIDHVLGLARLWLVPHGAKATEGAYLRLPIAELLRLVALESWRARAIVIGEDLGTVPADFPALLASAGVLGMRVLWFQKEGERFLPPERWGEAAVALTTTHDLPTVAGWWRGRDIDWRAGLELLPQGVSEAEERGRREGERAALWQALREAGRAGREAPQPPPEAPPLAAVLGFVAMSPAPLAIVPLEDALGLAEQPNLPGTTAVHPNWLQRLAVPASQALEAADVAARLAAVAEARPMRAVHGGGARVPAVPRATQRLQFHAGFTLDDARAWVGYFARLGISHLYASPLTTSRAGSTHGYDVVDPLRIDPEIGGSAALRRLVATLREHGMGLVADIVPNHMGVASPENAWWQDVLEWGPASPHAQWFDIDWEPNDRALHGKLLAPFLGAPYGETLASGDLKLSCDFERGSFFVAYHEHRFPVAPASHAGLLRAADDDRDDAGSNGEDRDGGHRHDDRNRDGERADGQPLAAAIALFEQVGAEADAATVARWLAARSALREAAAGEAGRRAIEALLALHAPGTPQGRERLHALLERQHYRLAWWRTAADEINWRRFFEVSDLAGLAVERPEVFEASHALVFELYAEGLIDGLRIDHIDGLADPEGYCLQLRERLAALQPSRPEGLREGRPWLVVEKILGEGESLPAAWQTDGSSGYDFMDEAGALLHDPAGAAPLAALWRECSGRAADFAEEALHARRQILAENLAAEREACARAFHRVARERLATRDWALTAIRRVMTELLVHFPVYRSYPSAHGRSAADRAHIAQAAAGARGALRAADHALLEQLERWLLDTPQSALQRRAQTRFEQLSAPLTAKSVEDTAFYRHGRLLSRNEVGSDPRRFALGIDEFHRRAAARAAHWPAALLATATHDHKRGEDLRARLAVLSERPEEWAAAVRHWRELNAPARERPDGGAPGGGHELMLYQMLVGAWPLELEPGDRAGLRAFAERIDAWQLKALREAKQASAWTAPDEAHEAACRRFLFAALGLEDAAPDSADFVAALKRCVDRIAPAGALNGLAQTLLRITVPGVPDLYQGCEFWDFSLVDPDNRRPVDWTARCLAFERDDTPQALMAHWRDGRVKQALIARALGLRRDRAALFAQGDYLPLAVEGGAAGSLIAFARRRHGEAVIAVASLHAAARLGPEGLPCVPAPAWGDTAVVLPPDVGGARDWTDALSGHPWRVETGRLAARELLADFPVALLFGAG